MWEHATAASRVSAVLINPEKCSHLVLSALDVSEMHLIC